MSSGLPPNITAVLNIFREGLLAHSSLLSMVNARAAALKAGIQVDILVIADCPDRATLEYLDIASNLDIEVVVTDVDDLGLARNTAVSHGRGQYLAFLDGDDLWGRNWLVNAFRAGEDASDATVWHPEANLYFGPGGAPNWFMHQDVDTEFGDWVALGFRNHWTSLSFGLREVYEKVPYRATALDQGFGYEDWCWNAETVAHGILHRRVPGTVHLIRQKAKSLVRRMDAANALVTPHSLFRNRVGLIPAT